MSKTKTVNTPIVDKKPFNSFRLFENENSKGEPYRMAFIEFKEKGASLNDKERFVAFNDHPIDVLAGVNTGEMVEIEYQPGKDGKDPVILDAQVVS